MENTEGQSQAAAAPVTSGQPQAAPVVQTQGHISPQPVTQAQPDVSRYVSQINGMKGLVDPLTQAGVTSADQIQALIQKSNQFDSLTSKGINIDAMLQGANQQQQSQVSPGDQPFTVNQAATFFDTREANATHSAGFQDLNTSLNTMVSELASDEGSRAVFNGLMRQVVEKEYADHGQQYPSGHPLAGKTMPLSKTRLDTIKSSFMASVDDTRGMFARQQVAQAQTVTPGQTGSMQTTQGGQAKEMSPQEKTRQRITEMYNRNVTPPQ